MNKKLLPARLKELRTIHGHTQDYVASVLGIARQTYSHYETAKGDLPQMLYSNLLAYIIFQLMILCSLPLK